MRAIYLNLDRAPDRREWMESQGRKLGVTLERLQAIDGALLDRNPFPSVPVGGVGCFLSHRRAWTEIAKGDDTYALVLEDDSHLSVDLPKFITDKSWIPANADLIHLERSLKRCIVKGPSRRAHDRRLWKSITGTTGTAAYLISKTCAQRFVHEFTSIDIEFDQILFNGGRRDLIIYKMLPALAIQDMLLATPRFKSLIEREEEFFPRNLSFSEKLGRESRRILSQILNLQFYTKEGYRNVEFK